jgi:hypothetical protein
MQSEKRAWTEAELDESILRLCEERPGTPMSVCSRVLEHCRRLTPSGTRASLLLAMRRELDREMTLHLTACGPRFAL